MDDYHLLAELNTIAASRYATMTERAQAYVKFMQHVHKLRTYACFGYHLSKPIAVTFFIFVCEFILCCSFSHFDPCERFPDSDLEPHLAQIDELEANTKKLHQLVMHLDQYTANLGMK